MGLDFLGRRKEFRELLEAINQGKKGLQVSGLTAAATPLFLSSLADKLKKKVVFIRPVSASLSRAEEQCRFFLSRFSSSLTVETLPQLAQSPYQEVPPSLDVISRRMKCFHSLLHDSPSLVITNIFGLLKPFPSPENLKGFFIKPAIGSVIGRDRLLQVLAAYGYKDEDLVASPGEYAWRGGIVDVFSPWAACPCRLEFSGDEIISLRYFDSSSQCSIERLDSIIIPSLREFPGDSSFFEEWADAAREKNADFAVSINDKLDALKRGDVFPSFVFLSLIHSRHYVSFNRYLEGAVFIIENPDEVEKEREENLKEYEEHRLALNENREFSLPPGDIFPPYLWRKLKKEALLFRDLASSASKRSFNFHFQSVSRFENKIPFFLRYLKKMQEERERCFIYLSGRGVLDKVKSLLDRSDISSRVSASPFEQPRRGEISLLLGELPQGFRFPAEKITFFSEKDIFTEEKVLVSRPSIKPFLSQFQDLRSGDHIVHADYGIGLFKGLIKMEVDHASREFIELAYRDDDRLFVPVEDLNLIQKYSGVGESLPPLDKLGSPDWQRTKARAKKAAESLARELLHLYARRKAVKGFGFSPAGAWQAEFERTFEHEETDDQLRSIKEIMEDMESEIPMDRLLCGDVGYGKTEVAVRAAFKAVMDGKQVAVLCPTTVLASQHLKTFRNRLVLFPARVEALTRLQTKTAQQQILEDLKKGLVDIIIGTHRLLSRDVVFHDPGLLIIDEEQRFGVQHKEKIKQMKAQIDVLTLTATPIPRTLNLSLSGLRDISLIETPPRDRLAVHTVVTRFSPGLVASAVKKEIAREGQVYYIHNRVEDIDKVARVIEKLVPRSRVAVIHGRISGALLEKKMMDFIGRKYDVLVATTIIENGIDIPLVNTLIVDQADTFGLAQLYQLRGRVGRSSRQAFAYFLVPPFAELTSLARKRLAALKEFSELGSGFRLAAKDLEIRGAGNLLGSEQHGNLHAVGFDYFVHLLDQAVRELKGEEVEEVKSEINLKVNIRIPEEYIPQVNLRLNLYKRVSSVERMEDIERIREELEDRFGPIPSGAGNLLHYGIIKHLAQRLKIRSLGRVGNRLVFKFYPSTSAEISRMMQLVRDHSGSLTPQGVLSLNLKVSGETELMDETGIILMKLSGM